MTVIREQTNSAGSGLALGVDMYFDFLHRQIAVARMFVVAGARLSTAIFSERGVELIGCGDRIETNRIGTVTEHPVGRIATEHAIAPGGDERPERLPRTRRQPTPQLHREEPSSTGSLTLHRPAQQRPAVDQVFDEIVGYMVAADITGGSTPARGMLVP